jgi:hypothetical protein
LNTDPSNADFSTRLVNAMKAPMGLTSPDLVPTPKLRAVFLAGAAVMLTLWGWGLTPAIQNWNNPREDGFSLVPAVYGTITMLPLGLMMLIGGVSASATSARRARVALVIAIALLVLMAALEILRRMSNATAGA